jgi:Zn-finger nucleic acid-binding protein
MEMTCPKCHGAMRQYERNGVTVDQCTECRGIFLDRGELEHLIEGESRWRANASTSNPPPAQYNQPEAQYGGQYGPPYPQKKRKKSFFEDLFD